METQFIRLNMIPSGVIPIFNISQYDVGRMLGVYVYAGIRNVNLDNYTVTVEATRSDGTAIIVGVTTNNNVGTFEVTPVMSNLANSYRAQLVITNENSRRIASLPFIINVIRAAMNENSEAIEEDASLYQQYTRVVENNIAIIRNNVSAEVLARQNADNTLQTNINSEKTARIQADNTLQANINSETSARQTADGTINARIDNIVAPSGQAPSAAEIIDARVTADGQAYAALGTAIRTQVTDLRNALDYYNNVTKIAVIDGGYLDINGGVVSASGYSYTDFVDYDYEDAFLFRGFGERTKPACCLYDSSHDFMTKIQDNAYYYTFYAPETAGSLRFASANSRPLEVYHIKGYKKDAIKDILGAEKIEPLYGGRISGVDGQLKTDIRESYYSDYVSVEKGDVILFKTSSISALMKYDTSKVFIRPIFKDGLTNSWKKVVINEDGYVRFSSTGASNPIRAYKIPTINAGNIGKNVGSEITNYFLNAELPKNSVLGYIKSDGTVADTDAWNSEYSVVDCNVGDTFDYTGMYGASAVGWIYYNDNDIIGAFPTDNSYSMLVRDEVVVIPEGVNKIQFCSCASGTETPVKFSVIKRPLKAVNKSGITGKKWCAIGDSITRGYGNNGRSYVEMIAEEVGVIATNKGISGSGYHNGNGWNQQFYNRLVGDTTQYDIYTILGSINDGNTPIGEITDNGTDTVGGCMNATINAIYAQNPSAKIGIISPTTAGSSKNFGYSGYFKEYIDFQKEFCAYNKIPFLDLNKMDNFRTWDDDFNDAYCYHENDSEHGDRTHPNEEGYKFFKGQILKFLESII